MVVQFLTPGCAYNGSLHRVTCSVATLPAGASATFEIQVQVKGSRRFDHQHCDSHQRHLRSQYVEQHRYREQRDQGRDEKVVPGPPPPAGLLAWPARVRSSVLRLTRKRDFRGEARFSPGDFVARETIEREALVADPDGHEHVVERRLTPGLGKQLRRHVSAELIVQIAHLGSGSHAQRRPRRAVSASGPQGPRASSNSTPIGVSFRTPFLSSDEIDALVERERDIGRCLRARSRRRRGEERRQHAGLQHRHRAEQSKRVSMQLHGGEHPARTVDSADWTVKDSTPLGHDGRTACATTCDVLAAMESQ